MTSVEQVETWYNECVRKFRTLDDLFENPNALHATLDRVAGQKPIFQVMSQYHYFPGLNGGKYYFDNNGGLMKIANVHDSLAKALTYHETIHYILIEYAGLRGDFDNIKHNKAALKREMDIHEMITRDLTETALANDKESLFFSQYVQNYPIKLAEYAIISTMVGIGTLNILSALNTMRAEVSIISSLILALGLTTVLAYINSRFTKQVHGMPLPAIELGII